MARDVRGKIARGESLDEADIAYARGRGIVVPPDLLPKGFTEDDLIPEEPQAETPEEPEAADEDEPSLEDMTKGQLLAMAEELGFTMNPKIRKDQMIALIQERQVG